MMKRMTKKSKKRSNEVEGGKKKGKMREMMR